MTYLLESHLTLAFLQMEIQFSLFNGISMFVVYDVNTDVYNYLNNDIVKINKWTHHWKMGFNPDLSNQAQDIIFSGKMKRLQLLPRTIGMFSDSKLSFEENLSNILCKGNKSTGVLYKLPSTLLLRKSVVTTYKPFV